MKDRNYADGLFLGYIHPNTAPGLLLDARINWSEGATELPKRFLAPLSGPDGEPVGFIEFAYHTTPGRLGRWAAVALHPETAQSASSNEFFSDLPVLHVLSPIGVTEYVSCGKMRLLRDQARAVREHDTDAIERAKSPHSNERP